MNRKQAAALAAALILISTAFSQGGARMTIALEDRFDTNPRQMALDMQIAGLCVGFVISWTDRLRRSVS